MLLEGDLWSLVAGAAAGCCCQSAVCALELGCLCRCRVPLQGTLRRAAGAAAEQSAAAECRCKTLLSECCLRFELCCLCRPLQGAAVKALFALWSLVAGAAAGCRFRVPLQGAAALECCPRIFLWYLGSLLP